MIVSNYCYYYYYYYYYYFRDCREPRTHCSTEDQVSSKISAKKGSSVWLTLLPLQEQGFNISKREFRDAVKLRYDCPFDDIPSVCACEENFTVTVDHGMICKGGVFVIRRHNELRDHEADLLSMVFNDVEVEPVLQDITEEQLMRGSNRAQDARLDQDQEPQQIYRIHENDEKRLYSRRVLDV